MQNTTVVTKMEINRPEKKEAASLPNRKQRSLVTSGLSNWLPLVANTVISFFLTPFLINHLGQKGYGVWILATSILGYYGLMRLSIGTGIMRYVPFYIGRNNYKAASETISSGLSAFLVVGIVMISVSVLIAKPIARFYQGGTEFATLVLVLGFVAAAECPLRIFEAALRAQERWLVSNIVVTAKGISLAVGFVTCIYFGCGIVEMGYVFLANTTLAAIVMAIIFIRLYPAIHLRVSMAKWSRARELVSFGVLTLISTFAYGFFLQGHKLIIGKIISLEAVSVYTIAAIIVDRTRNIAWAPIQVAWPRFALLDGQNDRLRLAHLFSRGTFYSSIFGSGVFLLVLVVGPPFIRLWVGQEFANAQGVLIVLSIGCLIESAMFVSNSFLGGTGRQTTQAIFATIEAALGLSLSILLGRRMGLVGVALGFTISVILIRGLILTWYICLCLRISVFQYYVGSILRPWLVVGSFSILVYSTGLLQYVYGWFSLVILTIATGFLYTLCVYAVIVNHEEKEYILSKIRKLSARILNLTNIRKHKLWVHQL